MQQDTRPPSECGHIPLAQRAACLVFHYFSVGIKETDNIWENCLCFVSKRLNIAKPCYSFQWLYAISKLKKHLGVKELGTRDHSQFNSPTYLLGFWINFMKLGLHGFSSQSLYTSPASFPFSVYIIAPSISQVHARRQIRIAVLKSQAHGKDRLFYLVSINWGLGNYVQKCF